MNNVLAFSGGKDSTCLAIRLAELGEPFSMFFTPTGDESSECIDHIAKVAALVAPRQLIVRTCGTTLFGLIEGYDSLPNNRQRWCTRQLKIEPAKAYLLENPGSTLLVGLRADEEHREGMWGDFATYRYPMREWDWGIKEVKAYLKDRGVTVPDRTDCDLCYDQRLGEWYKLWRDKPEKFARGEALEKQTGHTFRSPSRDTWPASLAGMRAEFEKGRLPRGISLPMVNSGTPGLFQCDEEDDSKKERCRVCSL